MLFFSGSCTVKKSAVEEKQPQKLWLTFLGGEGWDYSYSMRLDSKGDIYVTGTSEEQWWKNSTQHTPAQAMVQLDEGFIARLDINGSLLDTIPLNSIVCFDFTFDQGDNFCIIGMGGEALDNPIREPAETDILIARMTRDGQLLWHTYMGSEKYHDVGNDVAAGQNGEILVVGRSERGWGGPVQAFNGFYDAVVAKFDAAGRRQWHTFLGSTEVDSAHAVEVSPEGYIFVAGNSSSSWGDPIVPHSGYEDGFIAKMDGNGNVIWNTFIRFDACETCTDIILDEMGDIFVAGTSLAWLTIDRQQVTMGDVFIARLSREGDLLWKFEYGTDDDDLCTGIAIDENNSIYMIGESDGDWEQAINSRAGLSDTFLAKFTDQGTLDWIYFMGCKSFDIPGKIALHPTGAVILAGMSKKSWGESIRGYSNDLDIFVTSLSLFLQ